MKKKKKKYEKRRYRKGENDGSTCLGRSVEIGSTIPDRKRARLHGRWSDRIDENCNGPAAVKRSNFAREQRHTHIAHNDTIPNRANRNTFPDQSNMAIDTGKWARMGVA